MIEERDIGYDTALVQVKPATDGAPEMKERPIIFGPGMINAILEGRKTQTRRVVSPQNSIVGGGKVDWVNFCWDGSAVYRDTCQHGHTEEHKAPIPFVDGKASKWYPYNYQYLHVPYRWHEDMTIYRIYPKWDIGDRLWVRETWYTFTGLQQDYSRQVRYHATEPVDESDLQEASIWLKKPSIHMPRWASRLTLEITDVRVERLQEISRNDCLAEGVPFQDYKQDYKWAFRKLWDSLNAKRGYGWETNPWVWVIGFKMLDKL